MSSEESSAEEITVEAEEPVDQLSWPRMVVTGAVVVLVAIIAGIVAGVICPFL